MQGAYRDEEPSHRPGHEHQARQTASVLRHPRSCPAPRKDGQASAARILINTARVLRAKNIDFKMCIDACTWDQSSQRMRGRAAVENCFGFSKFTETLLVVRSNKTLPAGHPCGPAKTQLLHGEGARDHLLDCLMKFHDGWIDLNLQL